MRVAMASRRVRWCVRPCGCAVGLPMQFRGRERHSVDAKGRTSMPARFRDVLSANLPAHRCGQLVVVPWFEPCLRVFPVGLWEKQQERFDEEFGEADLFGFDPDESDFRRFVYGSALDVTLDANGRLLLTQDLREHAGIDREVYWVGLGPMLELWSPEAFRERIGRDQAALIRQRLRRPRDPQEDAQTGGGG